MTTGPADPCDPVHGPGVNWHDHSCDRRSGIDRAPEWLYIPGLILLALSYLVVTVI